MAYLSLGTTKLVLLCHIVTRFCHSFAYFRYLCGRKRGILGGCGQRYARSCLAVRLLLLSGTPAYARRYTPIPCSKFIYFLGVTKNDYSF